MIASPAIPKAIPAMPPTGMAFSINLILYFSESINDLLIGRTDQPHFFIYTFQFNIFQYTHYFGVSAPTDLKFY